MTRLRFATPLMIALAALAGCGKSDDSAVAKPAQPVANVAPPAGTSWVDTVSATPEGGMRMGNPDAPVKLMEYAAFTCPHCRDFTAEAAEKLTDYVKSGRVSWEFRPFLLSGTDVVPSLLAQCSGPAPFFAMSEQLYAAQSDWIGKLIAVPEAEQTRWRSLPPEQQFAAIAKAAGLDQFFRQRGVPQGKIDACLSDRKAADALVALRDKATNQDKVTGTPTFFINGRILDATASWAALEPGLRAALGG